MPAHRSKLIESMRRTPGGVAKSGKATACKAVIRRFESARHLFCEPLRRRRGFLVRGNRAPDALYCLESFQFRHGELVPCASIAER